MDYSGDELSDDDNCNNRNPSKKRKLNKKEHGNTIKEMLKESSVLLQNTLRNKFIEVGIVYDGKAYSMISGKIGSNGTKQTRNFRTKQIAFNSALKLLNVNNTNKYIQHIIYFIHYSL